MSHHVAALIVALVGLTFAKGASAQEEGPKAGTWGAEAGSGGSATLLRFRNPTSAWTLGFAAAYTHQESRTAGFGGTSTRVDDLLSSELRFGLRKYRENQSRVKPFTTVGVILGYNKSTLNKGWRYGAATDFGAAYFFSPHVSLGTAGEFSLTYQDAEDQATAFAQSQLTARFSGFRLLGAVYF